MWKSIVIALAATLLAVGPAEASAPGPIDPDTGTIAGFTYGPRAYNTYPTWSGGFFHTWVFSNEQLGYQGAPVAGQAFYLHARTDLVSPHAVTGDVLVTIDQDAGGLPLRYAPSASMPLKCTLTQFDPVLSSADRPCRSSVTTESGQFVVTNLETMTSGFSFNVEIPVVVDAAGSGDAAMTAMWATTDVSLSSKNVVASVPITVAPKTNPQPAVKNLPKKLRKYPKVKSLTPKVCKVHQRKVTVLAPGLCKLKGTKAGKSTVVKVRY